MKLASELTPSDFGICSMDWWFRACFGGLTLIDQDDWYSSLFETLCESLIDQCGLRDEYEAAETDEEIESFTLQSLCARSSHRLQYLAWTEMLHAFNSIALPSQGCQQNRVFP